MKILVTGANGFIGSHMIDVLMQQGHEVWALDKNCDALKKHLTVTGKFNNCHFISVDISDSKQLNQKVKTPFDWIFHLAGMSNIVPSIENPDIYHAVNVTGTLNILQKARHLKIKKFIYTASSSCYGIPDIYPTPETAKIKPEYPYALTKYIGELYALQWAKIYKLPVISLRLFNVYGPRVRTYGTYGPVLSIFMAQKIAGKPFTVVGNGKQTRDFTYVTDVVEAFIAAAKSNISGEVFNVGSGGTYSINQMVKIIGGKVAYIPKRPGEPDCTYADIGKITKQLHWMPKVSFSEGMEKVIADIEYWRNAPVWTPAKIKTATRDWFKYLNDSR